MTQSAKEKLVAVGKIIKDKRKKVGLSQDRIADALNLQQNAISQIEQGKCINIEVYLPRLEKLLAFPAGALTKIVGDSSKK